MPDYSLLLSLLYARPDAAVVRLPCGRLVVTCAPGDVVLTREALLDEGMDALLKLAA